MAKKKNEICDFSKVVKIGYAVLPSKMLEKKEFDVLEIKVTCGGGVGGSLWKEYVTPKEFKQMDDMFYKFTDIFGKTKMLNRRYIVEVTEKKCVQTIIDSTRHTNFYKEVCKSSHIRTTYVIDKDSKIVYTNDTDDLNMKHLIVKKEENVDML